MSVVTADAAHSLSGKLGVFRAGLDADEQNALDALLKTFGATARTATKSGGFAALNVNLDAARTMMEDPNGPEAITPTVTTVTITTTVASHPIITCD